MHYSRARAGSNQFIANRLEISAMQKRRGLWKRRDIPFVSHKKSAMAKRTSQSSDPGPSAKTSRFQFASDDDDFEELSRGYVPQNTSADTQKCLKLFNEWAEERNKRFPQQKVPQNIILSDNLGDLCQWLCRFSTKIRKKDGTRYPPRTIHHYLMGIQRYIRTEKNSSVNIITQSEFNPLKKLLDALYRKLHSEGLGCSLKTEAVTEEDEEQLWAKRILDPETPQGLLNCVFFLNGKNFCLRGGVEHRNLKPSQLRREVVKMQGKNVVRYTYTEYVSKNRAAGLKQLKQGNKVVHQYESACIERCHVLLLDKYLSKIPPEAKKKDIFYLKPKADTPLDALAPWYTNAPIGKNVLYSLMKTMADEAQLDRKVTNHSLRAYGVTKLYKEKVPEKLIMDRSGHRTIEGVRHYARVSEEQQFEVCRALENKDRMQVVPYCPSDSQGPSSSGISSLTIQRQPLQPLPVQSLQPLPLQQPAMFQGCTFANCTIQMAAPPPVQQHLVEDYSAVDLKQLLDF